MLLFCVTDGLPQVECFDLRSPLGAAEPSEVTQLQLLSTAEDQAYSTKSGLESFKYAVLFYTQAVQGAVNLVMSPCAMVQEAQGIPGAVEFLTTAGPNCIHRIFNRSL